MGSLLHTSFTVLFVLGADEYLKKLGGKLEGFLESPYYFSLKYFKMTVCPKNFCSEKSFSEGTEQSTFNSHSTYDATLTKYYVDFKKVSKKFLHCHYPIPVLPLVGEFESSVNPITTRGADYAHHIIASPPGIENPAAALI